jgi:acyl-CoA reductase-like NAD-dependent aldehyde dehydrogenase
MKTELYANVRDFLASPLPNLIGGKPHMTTTEPVLNPSDGSVLAHVSMGGAKEINLAITAAEKALPAW